MGGIHPGMEADVEFTLCIYLQKILTFLCFRMGKIIKMTLSDYLLIYKPKYGKRKSSNVEFNLHVHNVSYIPCNQIFFNFI